MTKVLFTACGTGLHAQVALGVLMMSSQTKEAGMNKAEKELVVQILANVDDIQVTLSPVQRKELGNAFRKIFGNCRNLLDGVPEKEVSNG